MIALGTWPERSANRAGGRVGVALDLGGSRIEPGYWLYADEDGVLVCRQPLTDTY
ncbi:putative regulator of ribonuclease activity [compost metagenome]